MQYSFILPIASSSVRAEALLWYWLRNCAELPSVQAATPATETRLLAVLLQILADTGDVNIDHQDVWEVLSGATSLQFGMATGEGYGRAEMVGQQLWANSTVLGDTTLLPNRILLVFQRGAATELGMDELTQLMEYTASQADEQAEVVFGDGSNSMLGENIQIMILGSRRQGYFHVLVNHCHAAIASLCKNRPRVRGRPTSARSSDKGAAPKHSRWHLSAVGFDGALLSTTQVEPRELVTASADSWKYAHRYCREATDTSLSGGVCGGVRRAC